jgi:HSP20 family protein
MAENVTNLPIKREKSAAPSSTELWRPFETLRGEIDRMFDDFGRGLWPSWGRSLSGAAPQMSSLLTPAVDVVESEKSYEITTELPGMDEKNIEVKLADGILTIKGEKQEAKEEKEKNYYRRERSYGAFERSFEVPETVQVDKIEANFSKGVLKLMLPKKAEAQKPAKKIEVKAA